MSDWKVTKQDVEKIKANSLKKFSNLFECASISDSQLFQPCLPTNLEYISTHFESLDHLLGGGFAFGHVSEIYGDVGTGKTQLCAQLLASYCINAYTEQCNRSVIYIDTENGFVSNRLQEIVKSFHKTADLGHVLGKIYFKIVLKAEKLVELISDLPGILNKSPEIRMIIIDSIAAPFWRHLNDNKQHTGLVVKCGLDLVNIAIEHDVCIIVTNRIRYAALKVGKQLPSLGDYWSHVPNLRLYLAQERQERTATIVKSFNNSRGSVKFQINSNGFSL
ncbi:DNA repair protein RAD51 3 [Thelohanellus kitauei]|uniref:DNA repair protein RAD51 homolog 3 n=1 Tax=Thelohanellus kitauei TaxID=669202 RepID=A0A0C2MM45_THEKT|nr:DNA repair protein RAD51 3 [Thelohanellus kitauei]